MPNTFLWHDYQTFGLDPSLGRPYLFTAIRTDHDLNIIGDPILLYCKPSVDFLPTPETCLINGITPRQALSNGLLEAEFANQIYFEMMVPGTTAVSFNSAKFVEEITINLFYRNFLDIYSQEWVNNSSSCDVTDMFRMISVLRPGSDIEWPVDENGKPSFVLDQIKKANNLALNKAHEAFTDIYAAIEMARMIRQRHTGLFNYLMKNNSKDKIVELLNCDSPVIYFSRKFEAEKNSLALIVPLIAHPSDKNAMICWNLKKNPDFIESMVADMILEKFALKLEEEIGFVLIQTNKVPCILKINTIKNEDINNLGLDFDVIKTNLLKIKSRIAPIQKAACVIFNDELFGSHKTADPDQPVYGGFLSTMDRNTRDLVSSRHVNNLADLSVKFKDDKLNQLLIRYKGRNSPQILSPQENDIWLEFLKNRFLNGGDFSYKAYFKKLDKLKEEHGNDDTKQRILEELEIYAMEIIAPILAELEAEEGRRVAKELEKATEYMDRYEILYPEGRDLHSRVSAKHLRLRVDRILSEGKTARINLKNVVSMTEGYADELFSVLVAQHDLDWFLDNLKLLHQPPYAERILNTIASIILRRLDDNKNVSVKMLVKALTENKKIADIVVENIEIDVDRRH